MVGLDKVDPGENGGTMEARGEILEMRNRVAIGNSVVVKGATISAGSPDFLGTRWSSDAQALDEGRTMLNSTMCWNSFRAAARRSEARRRGLAWTAGPVVTIR